MFRGRRVRAALSNEVGIPADLEAVTSRASEVDGTEVGLAPGAVEGLWESVLDLYRSGLNPAIALCVRKRGQVVLDRAVGHARGNAPGEEGPGVPVTTGTPFCIFSASKAITAMVVHLLDDRGSLHVGDRVCEYVPEFGQHGKEWVTIQHVLTHRAGIPSMSGEDGEGLLGRWEDIVGLLCDAKPSSRAGRRLAYHAVTGGFILGEVVRRVAGKDIRAVLHDEILGPLGFDLMNYGVPASRVGEVAVNAFTGPPVPFPASRLVTRALGVPFERAVAISNGQPWLTSIVPAGNVIGTANEVCRFYQMLLNGGELDGVRIMEPRTIRRATSETAYLELDLTLSMPVRYGVGLMLGTKRLSPFGPHTRRAFGHVGFINVITWADPQRDTAVALLTSGKPFIAGHLRRLVSLLSAISGLTADGR